MRKTQIAPDKKESIINYFLTNKDNTIMEIAKIYNLSFSKINVIIEEHFIEKMKLINKN